MNLSEFLLTHWVWIAALALVVCFLFYGRFRGRARSTGAGRSTGAPGSPQDGNAHNGYHAEVGGGELTPVSSGTKLPRAANDDPGDGQRRHGCC